MPVYTIQNLVVGSTPDFTLYVKKDGTVWDITGATVSLYLRDPEGNWSDAYPATVSDGPAGLAHYQTDDTVLDASGEWLRQWHITKSGITLRTEVIPFSVLPFLPTGA